MDDKDLKWQVVSTKHIVSNKWVDFREVDYRMPDGSIGKGFYNMSRTDYVVILAFDEEGRVICERQYRHGIGELTTEFPAGGIESGSLSTYSREGKKTEYLELAFDTARRELLEETGYASDDWQHLLTVPSNATMADNYAFIYVAKNCRKVSEQSLDETEYLNCMLKTPEEIDTLIDAGEFQQAVQMLAWERYKNRV